MVVLLIVGGCASNQISLRSVPKSPLVEELNLSSNGGPKTTERTAQLLRVYNLSDELGNDYRPLIAKLQAINDREPSADKVYAIVRVGALGRRRRSSSMTSPRRWTSTAPRCCTPTTIFSTSGLAATRNPYDPEYRGACDLYNGALESALRIVSREE